LTSEVSARARALVEERLPAARGLGQSLAALIDEPDAFVALLADGFARLADQPYADEQERVAPGSGLVIGVRWPLISAVARQLRQPLREGTASSALWLAQRLAEAAEREIRLFSHVPLRRALADDPERSWQLMRQLARAANEWISVDSLAELYAQGVLHERFRWAELEQLVYSADHWERRLVGSTVARLPLALPRSQRVGLADSPALGLIGSLLGDDQPTVQKALSWALRAWHEVDAHGVEEFIRREAEVARATNDGHRAWVLRDALTLPALEHRFVAQMRAALAGVRRQADTPSTSSAAHIARGFKGAEQLADRAVALQGARQRLAGRQA
jgi:3-methyladenine DNA glycosylase AlkD